MQFDQTSFLKMPETRHALHSALSTRVRVPAVSAWRNLFPYDTARPASSVLLLLNLTRSELSNRCRHRFLFFLFFFDLSEAS
jgi:hypothetical protein